MHIVHNVHMRARVLALLVLLTTATHAQTNFHLPPLDRALPARAERIYRELSRRVDAKVAMNAATFIAPMWRLAGNPAFEASQQRIFDRLRTAGLTPRYETFPNTGMGWEQIRGTLRLDGPEGEVLLSRDMHRVALAINSFGTASGGAAFKLVDVGAGTSPAAYEGKDVAGAVVLASGALGAAWQQAVRSRGAAGVISSNTASYTRPDVTPDVLQWGSIPFDESRKSFGFKATPKVAARLAEALARGTASVHADIETVFHGRPNRTLVAEIPGRSKAEQRIVLVAHVQEPGANDNASGCGSLLAAALGIQEAVRRGALPAPDRTLTFLWVDEIRGSEQWIKEHAADVPHVVANDVA